jgi:uncharacterized protein (DUF2267 family)
LGLVLVATAGVSQGKYDEATKSAETVSGRRFCSKGESVMNTIPGTDTKKNIVDEVTLLERCKRWGGLKRHREAERAVSATLRALREGLFDDEAARLAEALPPHLARMLRNGAHTGHLTLPQFYGHVARYENVAPGAAVEHSQATCEALASLMAPLPLERLKKALPELAALFVEQDRRPHPESEDDA